MARSRSILHRLRSFAALRDGRRALLVEAALWLALARLALAILPFPRIARHLGTFTAPAEGRARALPADPTPEQADCARQVGWAVTRAARHVPFAAVCLPQAIAGKMMLRRRGITGVLTLGVARPGEDAIESHAWLAAAGVEVTGYPVAAEFTEIASFV
jgi:hypothetical protein